MTKRIISEHLQFSSSTDIVFQILFLFNSIQLEKFGRELLVSNFLFLLREQSEVYHSLFASGYPADIKELKIIFSSWKINKRGYENNYYTNRIQLVLVLRHI